VNVAHRTLSVLQSIAANGGAVERLQAARVLVEDGIHALGAWRL
jgi:hypothetical protein